MLLPPDDRRNEKLYHFLFTCLAVKHRGDGRPNSKAIAERLTDKVERLRRIVPHFFSEERGGDRLSKIPSATTGDVVAMLTRLRSSLENDYREHGEPYTRVLTTEDILATLYHLIELTPQEREGLGLQAGDGLTLLQRALLILQAVGGLENHEMLLRVYKAAVGFDFTQAEPALQDLQQVDELIRKTVQDTLRYLPHRPTQKSTNAFTSQDLRSTDDIVRELTHKVQREIRRLLARSGNNNNSRSDTVMLNSYIRHYIQPAFVTKLAQTLVVNERLTDQFPVYLKRLTIEAAGPLPFGDRELGSLLPQSSSPYPALLHPQLRNLDQGINPGTKQEILPEPGDYELASQEATRVRVEFYVKLPENYQPLIPRVFYLLANEDHRRIDFALSSTGIGGTLAHVIKVINQALLWDIYCLQDHFVIAHDVISTQEIIRDNVPSPIWAHSLVKLCRKETIGEALKACRNNQLCSYEDVGFADPIGHGDYCGFDFLLAQAQAAMQSRLHAIRSTGVMPQDYIVHLCQRTERFMALQDALGYFKGYPFSAIAMIQTIQSEIFPKKFGDRPLTKSDPILYFDAYLTIIEALLDEGAYRSAQRYLSRLQVLDSFSEFGWEQSSSSESNSSTTIISGSVVTRYLICLANYYFLYDTNHEYENSPRYLPLQCPRDINREGLSQRAWKKLDLAQKNVAFRLQKYVLINEISQGTFHPHYLLLARIYFLRTKLLIFHSQYITKDISDLPTERFNGQVRDKASIHWSRLYTAEKARLYAAANGEGERYACYAAMQCWIYLMAACTNQEQTLPSSPSHSIREVTLRKSDCLVWAKRLRDHALISYAETGRHCYNQIKEKSGLPQEYDIFPQSVPTHNPSLRNEVHEPDRLAHYRINKLPPIYEARGKTYDDLIKNDGNFLVFNMDLLAIQPGDISKVSPNHPTQPIYLFGTNSCYLFFARGMYVLCSDDAQEFGSLEDLNQEINWDEKLKQATRLLNMAWAIAEDGGQIQNIKENGNSIRQLRRNFADHSSMYEDAEYSTQEINSVRDLYPRRITEISDLGKIFSAACMVLRLYLATSNHQAELTRDITNILKPLYSSYHFKYNSTQQALLTRQKRYNGHLEQYLETAKAILEEHMQQAKMASHTVELKQRRDDLLKALFAALTT
jgi:hypothetical protein